MAVASVNPLAANAVAASPLAASTSSDTQDRFLKLLVSQLQNQDPLNPLDNAQVTSQMAQLSTVSGIDKLNASLASVLAGISALQPIQAAGLVGHDVAVEGKGMTLAGGTARGGMSLEGAADNVTVSITDASGAVVRNISLGAKKAGISTFAWDGKDDAGKVLPDGDYTFSVSASIAGKPLSPATLTVAKVQGIVPAADGFAVNLGSAGIVPFGSVAQIL